MSAMTPTTATLTLTGSVAEVATLAQRLEGGSGPAPEWPEGDPKAIQVLVHIKNQHIKLTTGLFKLGLCSLEDSPEEALAKLEERLAASPENAGHAEHDLNLLCGVLSDLGLWTEGEKLPSLKATLESMKRYAAQREEMFAGLSAHGIIGLGSTPEDTLAALDARLAPQAPVAAEAEAPSSAEAPDLDAPASTWSGAPELTKRVRVTYLSSGEVHEGNVREVDADKARFTFGKWGAPDRVAADGRTTWELVGTWPKGLEKDTHEAHKKELRAKKTPLAQITPWRTADQIEDGSWVPPASASVPAETAALPPTRLPPIGAEVGVSVGGQAKRGLVVSHAEDGASFGLVTAGEFLETIEAATSTWSNAEPLTWAAPSVGDLVEVSTAGSRAVQGKVTRAGLVDRWGYSAFEWLPEGTQDPVMAYLGRYAVKVLPPASTVPAHPAPTPVALAAEAAALAPHQPPLEWAMAPPVLNLATGQRAWAWLDHGAWPPTGPGRLEVVTVLAMTGREVLVQLDTGPQISVDIYDLKQVP